ncbi:Vacuolar sorting protein VPS1, dynamin [Handroanthus impetiginosus]|uniref:Vacuolar sorting protein VPS1, dynamin n=1 Tax=Handroanthus impetiginosus TaxID=429701 RepID=A0A2G9GH39_9LAMI|nr:Vacuolar sorting protein VPS1, dynamin [Handroanthus impetiginosus]
MDSLIHAKEEIMSPKAVTGTAPMMNVIISQEHRKDEEQSVHDAPIVSSYNDKIRPLLDAVDKLRHLKIMQEGIQLPTIVVVGDQSSGKSSVLESLAGIILPRGEGICTRVPLIMQLQNNPNPDPKLFLVFNEKIVPTDEGKIADDISIATEEIAGKGKGISGNPLTLIVKKKGVPDLTMVDLPGITRVPVHGQPEDIYEQISEIIMEFITPEESIILNVLSASVDFSTCESIRMSQRVDKTGERTLAVVTKADKSPEGLLEKVTADDVKIGLGYVCVRNRIGDESYEKARAEEAKLFDNHPLLSRMNKSMVGIPVLAEKLVRIQATIIRRCLPEIVRKINDKLWANEEELNKLPKHLNSVAEAMMTFLLILGSAKESFRKILVQGEFDEYPDAQEMHCTARLREMIDKYSDELHSKNVVDKYSDELHSKNVVDNDSNRDFLLDEIKVLEETKSIGLPNFLPKAVFLTLLQRKVKGISTIPLDFVEKAWNYIEDKLICVLLRHCENYPQLISSIRRAAKNLIAKKKQQSIDWVNVVVEMENLTDYTCHPEYSTTWSKLMADQATLMDHVNNPYSSNVVCIERFGGINIAHLRRFKGLVEEAYDVKMRITAYWDIVLRRMVDNMALHLLFSIKNLVNQEMQQNIIEELVRPQGTGLERMLEESPSVTEKRNKLKKSIKLLKESKNVVANIMDISFED